MLGGGVRFAGASAGVRGLRFFSDFPDFPR
jgi:hypothetical protein